VDEKFWKTPENNSVDGERSKMKTPFLNVLALVTSSALPICIVHPMGHNMVTSGIHKLNFISLERDKIK